MNDMLHHQMDAEAGAKTGADVGAFLRASRLRRGEELADVAAQLRIRLVYLEAIEDGRFDALPGNTYAVGFIRTYAEYLGLDGQLVVDRYRGEILSDGAAQDLAFPTVVPENGIPRVAIVMVGLLVVAVGYGAWYFLNTSDRFAVATVEPVPQKIAGSVADSAAAGTPVTVRPANLGQPSSAAAASAGTGNGEKTEAPAPGTAATTAATDSLPPASETDNASSQDAVETGTGRLAASAVQDQTPEKTETAPIPEPAIRQQATARTAPEMPPESTPESTPESAPETPQTTAAARLGENSAVSETPAAPESQPQVQAPSEQIASGQTSGPAQPAPQASPVAPASEPEPVEATAAAPEQPAPVPAANEAAPSEAAPSVPAPSVPATEPTAPEPAAREPASEQLAALPGGSDARQGPEPAATDAPAAGDNRAEPEAAPTAAVETGAEAPPQPAAEPAPRQIIIRAVIDSWIQVRDIDANQLVMTRLLRSGDTYEVPARRGLSLLTGNAGALEIEVDGKIVPSIGPVGTVRRNVALDAEKLSKGTAVTQ